MDFVFKSIYMFWDISIIAEYINLFAYGGPNFLSICAKGYVADANSFLLRRTVSPDGRADYNDSAINIDMC